MWLIGYSGIFSNNVIHPIYRYLSWFYSVVKAVIAITSSFRHSVKELRLYLTISSYHQLEWMVKCALKYRWIMTKHRNSLSPYCCVSNLSKPIRLCVTWTTPWCWLVAIHISLFLEAGSRGPFTRYVKLRVIHAPGMPGRSSPTPTSTPTPTPKETGWLRSQHGSRHVHYVRAVMHVGIANPRWRGKRSRHSRCMRNPQVYVIGKRPMQWSSTECKQADTPCYLKHK